MFCIHVHKMYYYQILLYKTFCIISRTKIIIASTQITPSNSPQRSKLNRKLYWLISPNYNLISDEFTTQHNTTKIAQNHI